MKQIELRQDIDSGSVRTAAKAEKNAKVCRRLLGIAFLLEGGSLREAHKIACLSERPFRLWRLKFNASGIEGLRSKKSSGRPPKINRILAEALRAKVLQGPSKEESIARYRLVDLQQYLNQTYQVCVRPSSIWYKLQDMQLTWKTCRQRHPKSCDATQASFKKTLVVS